MLRSHQIHFILIQHNVLLSSTSIITWLPWKKLLLQFWHAAYPNANLQMQLPHVNFNGNGLPHPLLPSVPIIRLIIMGSLIQSGLALDLKIPKLKPRSLPKYGCSGTFHSSHSKGISPHLPSSAHSVTSSDPFTQTQTTTRYRVSPCLVKLKKLVFVMLSFGENTWWTLGLLTLYMLQGPSSILHMRS